MPEGGDNEDIWQLASLGEAHVARGDWSQAAHWYGRFAARAGNENLRPIGTLHHFETARRENFAREPGDA